MKIQLWVSASLLLLMSVKGLAQDNNCDVKQLQVSTYDFVLKNLDSIKKYTPGKELITASFELTATGKVNKIAYYTAFGTKIQKEAKVWKGLEAFVKESFSRCPDSHFYNGREQVLKAVIPIPLVKEGIAKAKKEVENSTGYVAAGAGKTDVARDSKFAINVKSFTIKSFRANIPYNKTLEPVIKEGIMDGFRSKMVKLSDVYTIAFDVVKLKGTNYLKYTVYERVDNKSQSITSEGWRPIVNNKVQLAVKGIRDTHAGVKHIAEGEEFDLDIEIDFKK